MHGRCAVPCRYGREIRTRHAGLRVVLLAEQLKLDVLLVSRLVVPGPVQDPVEHLFRQLRHLRHLLRFSSPLERSVFTLQSVIHCRNLTQNPLSNNVLIGYLRRGSQISSTINSTFVLGNEGTIIIGAMLKRSAVCARGIIISSRSVFRAGRQSCVARRNNYPRISFRKHGCLRMAKRASDEVIVICARTLLDEAIILVDSVWRWSASEFSTTTRYMYIYLPCYVKIVFVIGRRKSKFRSA